MIECSLVIIGVVLVVWSLSTLLKLRKKPEPVTVKRPAMPPVRPPAPARQSIPYSQGRLARSTSRDERRSDVLDEILSAVEDIADVVTTRKNSSRSDHDHAFSDSSNWDILDD
jgi:hypothetical protein